MIRVLIVDDEPTADGEKLREYGVTVIDRDAASETERARAVIHPKRYMLRIAMIPCNRSNGGSQG